MNKTLMAATMIIGMTAAVPYGLCDEEKGKINGGREFEKHCGVCHPKGGNIVDPKKPLNMKSLKANGVKNVRDIVNKMRNPGPGMTKFDKKTISDREAKAIAAYIMKTFR